MLPATSSPRCKTWYPARFLSFDAARARSEYEFEWMPEISWEPGYSATTRTAIFRRSDAQCKRYHECVLEAEQVRPICASLLIRS